MNYMVCGISDNNHTVLGFYGSIEDAMDRISYVKEEYNYDAVWYTKVDHGDCEIELV